ncbi:hypothetical protein C8R44DRAFT_677810 [Mycena epipterygia]|nr:hypothetical protein C8R44DRAFT_677810 [Mycena epipterygia]
MSTNTRFPRIAIVDIAGKGKGVIAKERIPRGTLIISEKPLIILHGTNDLEKIKALPSAVSHADDILFFMSFPCRHDEDPIIGRLKHFTPCVGDGAVGLCPTICRVNHTCYSPKGSPNAVYFWNVSTKEEELRALKEIHEEQEIEVSYMNNPANYADPLTSLREKFGFNCSCKGCARPAAERCASQQRILAYKKFVDRLPLRFALSPDPLQILDDIEAQILIICEEGYTGELCERARDVFQLCAYYGDEANARKWEEICRDTYALYQGPTSETVQRAQRLAAHPQAFEEWMQLGRRNLKGPSKQVLEYCYPKAETTQAGPNKASSPGVLPPSTTSAQITPSSVSDSPRASCPSSLPTLAASDAQIISASGYPTSSSAPRLSKGQKKKAKKEANKETRDG